MGDFVIAWTIRLSLTCCVLPLAVWAARFAPAGRAAKLLWTLGFVLVVFHVAAAFHFHHNWSHAAAERETARQTEEQLGFSFGAGIYFNYLFLAVWAIDLAWIWLRPQQAKMDTSRIRLIGLMYLGFIAFNSTAVFKSGWLRVAGIAGALGLVVCAWVGSRRTLKRAAESTDVVTLPK